MIRAAWQSFIGELDTPSAFRADPYGAATNQGTHWAIGVAAAGVICLVYFRIFGEMPHREAVGAAVVTAYLFLELRRQGWAGADTLTDTLFVGLGAGFALVSLEEIVLAGQRCLDPRSDAGLLLMAGTLVIYAAHLAPRMVRAWRLKRQA